MPSILNIGTNVTVLSQCLSDTNYYADKIEKIGEGNFGTVLLVKDKSTKKNVALKISKCEDAMIKIAFSEIETMKKHGHIDGIIKLYDYKFQHPLVLIFMKYCQYGSLETVYEKEGKHPFTEERLKLYFRTIISALAHVHEENLIHRDLKPANILLDQENHCYLTDFGFSTECANSHMSLSHCAATVMFAPPEYQYQLSQYTDIWSLGMVFLYLTIGDLPSYYRAIIENTAIVDQLYSNFGNYKYSMDFIHIVKCCLQKEPKSRMSAIYLLQQKFFQNNFQRASNIVPPNKVINRIVSVNSTRQIPQPIEKNINSSNFNISAKINDNDRNIRSNVQHQQIINNKNKIITEGFVSPTRLSRKKKIKEDIADDSRQMDRNLDITHLRSSFIDFNNHTLTKSKEKKIASNEKAIFYSNGGKQTTPTPTIRDKSDKSWKPSKNSIGRASLLYNSLPNKQIYNVRNPHTEDKTLENCNPFLKDKSIISNQNNSENIRQTLSIERKEPILSNITNYELRKSGYSELDDIEVNEDDIHIPANILNKYSSTLNDFSQSYISDKSLRGNVLEYIQSNSVRFDFNKVAFDNKPEIFFSDLYILFKILNYTEILGIVNCGMTSVSFGLMLRSIEPLTHLVHIDLQMNCLYSTSLEFLNSKINLYTALKILNLSFNRFGDTGCPVLYKILQKSLIEELYLRNCEISDSGVMKMCAPSKQKYKLIVLNLSDNKIIGSCFSDLASKLLPPMKGLKFISFVGNNITPQYFGEMEKLTRMFNSL